MTGNDEVRGALSAVEIEALARVESIMKYGAFDIWSDAVATICAALRRLQSPPSVSGEWLPIEGAPRDGTHLLLCTGSVVFEGKWADKFAPIYGSVQAGWYAYWTDCPVSPTHYQPLPPPPHAAPVSNEGDTK